MIPPTTPAKFLRSVKKLTLSADDSNEEYESFSTALLSYPPVIRILLLWKELWKENSLWKDQSEQTKFELGSQLGFIGELDFTSIPQEIFLHDYCNATPAEKKEFHSNFEGDSDKYARGIASWLIQMKWVTSHRKNISATYEGMISSADLQVYSLTRAGEKALLKAHGNSSNSRLPRIVMFEMLAYNKTPNAEFLSLQRKSIERRKSEFIRQCYCRPYFWTYCHRLKYCETSRKV